MLSTITIIHPCENWTIPGKPGNVDTKMHEVPLHGLCTHLSAMASVTSTKGRRLKLQKSQRSEALQLQFRFLGVVAGSDPTGTMKEDFRTIKLELVRYQSARSAADASPAATSPAHLQVLQ